MNDPNELIHKIGAAILTDPKYRDLDWDAASIVYDFVDNGSGWYGYVYKSDGSWEGRSPKDDDLAIVDMMERLQSVMEQQMGKKWIKAVVQLKREEQSIDFMFEYDDPKRWFAGPSNYEAVAAELRP